MAADLSNVPVVSVDKSNFLFVWPSLIHAIDTACLIGVDLELSGLGDRKSLTLRDIEERYTALSLIAKSRSILSIGIACFRPSIEEKGDGDETAETGAATASQSKTYVAQIYDILLLCMNDYVVEPLSLQFLVNHGFNFNKQCSHGLPYRRGNDEDKECGDKPSVRKLFMHLVESKKEVVFHNGFVDLVFLYQNLYADLPGKLAVFLADIEEMFTGGIFDTKYVAEFSLHYKASYLEYMFKRIQRLNEDHKNAKKAHVQVQFLNFKTDFGNVDFDDLRSFKGRAKAELCSNFASYGWCQEPSQCTKSHDVDLVLDEDFGKKGKKKRRKSKKNEENMDCDIVKEDEDSVMTENLDKISVNESENDVQTDKNITNVNKKGTHRAGYDAFMTGYALVAYLATNGEKEVKSGSLESACNRIFLGGKDQPLIIKKGNFAKPSKNHKKKLSKT